MNELRGWSDMSELYNNSFFYKQIKTEDLSTIYQKISRENPQKEIHFED
jgi:hypothetical protein